jgi:hypothetical protein
VRVHSIADRATTEQERGFEYDGAMNPSITFSPN